MHGVFKKKVVSLDEDFKGDGIDPDVFFGEVRRNLGLMENVGIQPDNITGANPLHVVEMEDPKDGEYGELTKELAKRGVKDPKALAGWIAKMVGNDKMMKWSEKQKAEELDVIDVMSIIFEMADDLSEDDRLFLFDQVDIDDDGVVMGEAIRVYREGLSELDEAIRIQKLKRHTAAERAKAKRDRKKHRSSIKRAARMYRKRNKRKIKLRAKRLLRKFGGSKGLAKKRAALSKGHKRLQMAGMEALANLREELEASVGETGEHVDLTVCEEAAIRMGMLDERLGEVFEMAGDQGAADVLYEMSDRCADLSERLEGVSDEDMSESDADEFKRLSRGTAKAMAAHEKMGAPTIWDFDDENNERD